MVRSALSVLGVLVGLLGFGVFVLAVLCLAAPPAFAPPPDPCSVAPGSGWAGSLVAPCAALSVAQVDDLRAVPLSCGGSGLSACRRG